MTDFILLIPPKLIASFIIIGIAISTRIIPGGENGIAHFGILIHKYAFLSLAG